ENWTTNEQGEIWQTRKTTFNESGKPLIDIHRYGTTNKFDTIKFYYDNLGREILRDFFDSLGAKKYSYKTVYEFRLNDSKTEIPEEKFNRVVTKYYMNYKFTSYYNLNDYLLPKTGDWVYDAETGQLIEYPYDMGKVKISYNSSGKIIERTYLRNTHTKSLRDVYKYKYNKANSQLIEIATDMYINEKLEGKRKDKYRYDQLRRLVRNTDSSGSNIYEYRDSSKLPVKKISIYKNGNKKDRLYTCFRYDEKGRLVEEIWDEKKCDSENGISYKYKEGRLIQMELRNNREVSYFRYVYNLR
ncbi:MAG: hypothetical protein ACI85I_002790, partial [Arenicella sp.]